MTIEASALVVATEAPATRKLLARTLGATERAAVDALLAEVSYAPLAVVHWREKEPGAARLPSGFGWLAPPRERCFALGTLFVSDTLGTDGVTAGGRRTFATFVGGVLTPERARLTDEELASGIAAELARLTGGDFGEVLHVERASHAVAQPTLGHAERITKLEGLLGDGPIALAGSWLGGGAMKDAVESGFRAADDVVARLARPTRRQSARPEPAPVKAKSGTPLAIVGASYRDVATEVRARLAAAERADDAPSKQLVDAGYADSVVFLETCSRVEWIVSSQRPAWAAEILKSSLAKRVPEARMHTKTGHAGAHYLMRVAMGLDSVAEGEQAVGRQLVLAFERAHKEATADRSLRLAWRAVQQLIGERRRRGVVRHGLGVQTLALEELAARGVQLHDEVLVLGLGEIGRAVMSSLKDAGYTRIEGHRRATLPAFMERAIHARAVVVCTGGPEPWVELPSPVGSVDGHSIVVDIGVPEQVRAAPGWTRVTLEDLLARPRRLLDDETRAWLVEQVLVSSDRLSKELSDPKPATALSLIDDARRVFLRETLPPLLEKLPQSSAEEVRRACAAFAHQLMERVRDGGAA